MRLKLLILGIAAAVTLVSGRADAQAERPIAETAALFDTTVAHLIELELALLEVRGQGQAEPHPSVTGITRQISALRGLLADFPDTTEVNAAVRSHLVRAFQARLASTIVAQRRMAARLDSAQPGVQALHRQEQLLRARLRELNPSEPQ
jgi:hypothetical protein